MTDIELVQAAMAGDHAAFEALYAKYRRLVRNTAATVLPDADFIDHVASDVWTDLAARKWHLVPGKATANGNIHGFISVATRRAALRRFTRVPPTVRYATPIDSDDEDSPIQFTSRHPSPEKQLILGQAHRRLLDAMDRLPGVLRPIAIARFLHDEDIPDIAARYGLRVESVRSYLWAARRTLREALHGYITLPATVPPKRTPRLRDGSPNPRRSAGNGSPSLQASVTD